MNGLVDALLQAVIGMLVFFYVLFPAEIAAWVDARARAHPASFCRTEVRGGHVLRLNRGQCAAAHPDGDAGSGDFLADLRAGLARRARP